MAAYAVLNPSVVPSSMGLNFYMNEASTSTEDLAETKAFTLGKMSLIVLHFCRISCRSCGTESHASIICTIVIGCGSATPFFWPFFLD